MQDVEGQEEIGLQLGEHQVGCRVFAADEHIIVASHTMFRKRQSRNFAQAAFRTVARDGVADLFGTGETNADQGRINAFIRTTPAHLQDKTGFGHMGGPAGALKIRALGQDHYARRNRRRRIPGAGMIAN